MPAVPPARLRRLALASLCAASALALTACGPLGQTAEASRPSSPSGPYPGLSGSEILNKAITATKSATSLRLRFATETTEDGPIGGDLAVDTEGDCAGTLQMGTEGGVEILKTGDTVYLRFDEKMLRSQAEGEEETRAALDLLLGKWVREKADAADAEDFAEFCDLDSYLEGFQADDTAAKRAGESTVGGAPTVVLKEDHQGEKATAHVAAKGTPHLLRLQVTGGDEPMDMTFSEFDEPVPVEKPAAQDIVDLD
ncbi:hypothetical protein [Streptomyces sp. I6]|uniref:hypothetical protein n=1 Tax=Streptomyces sp. I6 TaxID=2483113 RepID=UPI000F453B1F|nr:hypothetical protein [Streptomyces sp. I6]RNL71443.1 hypothetical protein EBF04_11140 [Streptomyces sp. I6]